MKKVLIINILLLIFFIVICEIYSYRKIVESFHPLHSKDGELRYTIPSIYKYEDKKNTFYTLMPKHSDKVIYKRPIAVFFCSYVEGGGIPPNEIFIAQLNKYSNRIIFGRGRSDTSTDFMYRQLIDKNIKLEIPDVEYIIYVYLRYHGQRYQRYTSSLYSSPDLRYKVNKDRKLEEVKPFLTLPFYMLHTVKLIQNNIVAKRVEEERKKGEPMLLKFLDSSYQVAKSKWPGVNFIFLEYPDGVYSLPSEYQYEKNLNMRNLPPDVIKNIEDIGFIYVNAEQLVGHELRDLEKYRHTDLEHPSGKAWEEVAEALVKKFNL